MDGLLGIIGNNPPAGSSTAARTFQSQATFKMLRRLHGQNLESQGLNNLSEEFQSFVTRAKFFSLGKLRRTWSHSAVEFMKYRRLLPMIVGDEHDPGSVFDEFLDIGPDGLPSTIRPENITEEKRISVTNVSAKATKSQLQSFFNKFGKVQSCIILSEKGGSRDVGLYATMPKRKWHGTCVITFKNGQSALKARKAPPDELIFYGQQMSITPYVSSKPRRRRTTSIQNTNAPELEQQSQRAPSPLEFSVGQLSRTSSASSLASTGTTKSYTVTAPGLPLDDLPDRALNLVLFYAGSLDRIRLERVNKRWLEAAATAWAKCQHLHFGEEPDLVRHFGTVQPLSYTQFRAIIRRCGPHLHSLSLTGINQLLDDKSISDIGAFCPHLTELDLSGIAVSPEALRALTESTTRLTRIAYRQMSQTNERAFWFLFKAIAGQIRGLDLRGCTRLRGSFFKLFGTQLEEVLLDGCVLLDDLVIDDICTRCTCIRILKLDSCKKLTDESLSLISRHLSELNTLTLCGEFSNFTADGLSQLARISSLQTISLDYNPLVDDNLLANLASSIPNLRHVSLAFAGSDKSISQKGLDALTKASKIESLDLSGLASVNGQILANFCAKCPELRQLILRSCIYLGDDGILEMTKLGNLEHVDLSGCILVSNKSVQELCNQLKNNESNPTLHQPISLVIGGTVCEPHKIRVPRNSRVVLDISDNSTFSMENFIGPRQSGAETPGEEEDDAFRILSSHRDFIADALQSEEEFFPADDPKQILKWAEKEAANLGLKSSPRSGTSK